MTLFFNGEHITPLKGLFDANRDHHLFGMCTTQRDLVFKLKIPLSSHHWVIRDFKGQVSSTYRIENKPNNALLYVSEEWIKTQPTLFGLFYGKPSPEPYYVCEESDSELYENEEKKEEEYSDSELYDEKKEEEYSDSELYEDEPENDFSSGQGVVPSPEDQTKKEMGDQYPNLTYCRCGCHSLEIEECEETNKFLTNVSCLIKNINTEWNDLDTINRILVYFMSNENKKAIDILSDRFGDAQGSLGDIVRTLKLLPIKECIDLESRERMKRLKKKIASTPLYYYRNQLCQRLDHICQSCEINDPEKEMRELVALSIDMAKTQADVSDATAPHISSFETVLKVLGKNLYDRQTHSQKILRKIVERKADQLHGNDTQKELEDVQNELKTVSDVLDILHQKHLIICETNKALTEKASDLLSANKILRESSGPASEMTENLINTHNEKMDRVVDTYNDRESQMVETVRKLEASLKLSDEKRRKDLQDHASVILLHAAEYHKSREKLQEKINNLEREREEENLYPDDGEVCALKAELKKSQTHVIMANDQIQNLSDLTDELQKLLHGSDAKNDVLQKNAILLHSTNTKLREGFMKMVHNPPCKL
jgi:hypothetical protein